VKATVEIEVPTEFVEARLAEIQADIRADGVEFEEQSAEDFFKEMIDDGEIAQTVMLLWGDETTVRCEIVSVTA
jgi:hypothetical protein